MDKKSTPLEKPGKSSGISFKPISDRSLSLADRIQTLQDEKTKLELKFTTLEADYSKKVSDLNYYWTKSEKLKEKETELVQKEKDLEELRSGFKRKSDENDRDRRHYVRLCKLHDEVQSEKDKLKEELKEKDVKVELLQTKNIRSDAELTQLREELAKFVADKESLCKLKDEKITQLESDAKQLQEDKEALCKDLQIQKSEVERQGQLILTAGDHILSRDNQIAELSLRVDTLNKEKIETETKIKFFCEEQQTLEQIVDKFRIDCDFEVPLGSSTLQTLAILVKFSLNKMALLDQCYENLKNINMEKKPEIVKPHIECSSSAEPQAVPKLEPSEVPQSTEKELSLVVSSPVEVITSQNNLKRIACSSRDNVEAPQPKRSKYACSPAKSEVVKIDKGDELSDVDIDDI